MCTPRVCVLIFTLIAGICLPVASTSGNNASYSQAVADKNFNPRVSRPAYEGRHPKVLFDEAHNNAVNVDGAYRPFVDLVSSDGYRVLPNERELSKKALSGCDILVIANPSGPQNQPEASAFKEEESNAIKNWVDAGGSLLLIISHLPFSAAADLLTKRLNVDITKGHTFDRSNYDRDSADETQLLFTRTNRLLQDHAITRGRTASERINQVITFSGTSLKGPAGSVPFLALADTAIDVIPPATLKPSSAEEAAPDHKQVSAAGRAQGIAMESGKGRVVILGEAAMLTAQITPQGFRFGMNLPGYDNRQLALNIMHWLSRLLK
jgi:hypothetical protein